MVMLRKLPYLLVALGAACVLAAGCGYRPVLGTLPDGRRTVRVPTVRNHTAYPGVTAPLTSALRRRLALSGLTVVNGGSETPRLEVEIVEVHTEPGTIVVESDTLRPVEAIWRIRATARLSGLRDGASPLETEQEVEGRSLTGANALAEERLGERRREDLLANLADAIVAELFER